MCFGVRDAIAQAEQLALEAPLTILGELVHNPIVRDRLHAHGASEGTLDNAQSTSKRVMITAHGVSDSAREALNTLGLEVADATCPLVRHAHLHLKELVRDGYFPVVIGLAGHVEVRGLTEDFADAVVVNLPGFRTRLASASSRKQRSGSIVFYISSMKSGAPGRRRKFGLWTRSASRPRIGNAR